MDPSAFGSKAAQNIPPLQSLTMLGTLQYADSPTQGNGTPIKLEINGTIDKGFFLADNEWTCYRRNYFSCVCSYNISPPNYNNAQMQFSHTTPNGQQSVCNIYGFAMCISAVVSDNEGHAIELVQHTPKRDKGPIAKPEKTRLHPKPAQPAHHGPLGAYGHPDHAMMGTSRYDQTYPQAQQGTLPTEHTFERIQFKQATANNGKRRAAQQYYQLLIELWGDTGTQSSDPYIKLAFRKSAKMIVRGRSPGHYQAERRGSASSGPGGSAGSLGYGGSQVMGSDFGSTGSAMLSGAYSGGYDQRPASHYGTHSRPHQDLEHVMSAEEAKAITQTRDYQYYPAPIFEGSQDVRSGVELFSHQRSDQEAAATPMTSAAGAMDVSSKVKQEYDRSATNLYYTGNSFYTPRCGRFEGQSSSRGYYPAMITSPSTLNIT